MYQVNIYVYNGTLLFKFYGFGLKKKKIYVLAGPEVFRWKIREQIVRQYL